MDKDNINAIEQLVDYLLPELTPYESTLYLYLFRNSILRNNIDNIRIGKRTLADRFCRSARGETVSYTQVSKMLDNLEQKGCIKIGDTDRFGTLYTIILPSFIPLVIEKMTANLASEDDENYFANSDKRIKVFERDKWICSYCGEKVTQQNATLDHFIPQSKGGIDNKDNLRTCCLTCNSLKSGKTFDEAAPLLLKNIQARRVKSQSK